MNNMNCDDINNLLSAYIDGELAAGERARVDAHLAECAACRDALARLENAVALVQELDELEVPAELARALRQTAQVPAELAPPKRRTSLKTWYLAASGAVAALALASALVFGGDDILGTRTPTKEAVKSAESTGESRQREAAQDYKFAAPKAKSPESAHDIDSATNGGPADGARAQTYAGGTEKSAAQDGLLMRGLPGERAADWPVVLASKTDYTAASAEALLDTVHKRTEGLYTVDDAAAKRAQFIDALVTKVTARGGQGGLLQSPVNALLDRTKRAALPVYLEKATFNKQPCWVLVIKWGFGGGGSELYKTSLYVTDITGWNILHYASE